MLLKSLVIGDTGKLFGVGIFDGVLVVDAVHLGGLDNGLALQLHAAQGGSCVCGKIGIARAGRTDDHTPLFQVAQGAAADKGLTHDLHVDGREHAGGIALLLKHVLHGKRVHDRGKHAHVICA